MPSLRTRARALAAAPLALVLGAAGSARAHHGWSSFSTRHAYFAAGAVTYVRWGDPHGEVRLRIARTDLPTGWAGRPQPPGADEGDFRATMASARPYGGGRRELRLVLAGPGWMRRWGLERPLRVGETVEVVGFLNAAEDRELRPVMFWLDDGQGVWQQLTALPQRPEPAPTR